MPMPEVAYSYQRFSSAELADGDSIRRQHDLAATYCHRRVWMLDGSLNLRDLGESAWRGDNVLAGNLRTFLAAVESGCVPTGSVLIVESFDRISRPGIGEVVRKLLRAGIRIVTLTPEREFGPEAIKSLSKGALEIQLILEQAAEGSDRKSKRVRAACADKHRNAGLGVRSRHKLPCRVRRDGYRLVLDQSAARPGSAAPDSSWGAADRPTRQE
jgi:DNA invertase Pin-like site-specific DNA recombinase